MKYKLDIETDRWTPNQMGRENSFEFIVEMK